jgi:hypothetical protein
MFSELVSLVWDLSLGIVCLGTFSCDLSLGNFRLGSFRLTLSVWGKCQPEGKLMDAKCESEGKLVRGERLRLGEPLAAHWVNPGGPAVIDGL